DPSTGTNAAASSASGHGKRSMRTRRSSSVLAGGGVGTLSHTTSTGGRATQAYRDSERGEMPAGGVRTLGRTWSPPAWRRESDPVVARSWRETDAQASSAAAWSVSNASTIGQAWPDATSSTGVSAPFFSTSHSAARRPDAGDHWRAASATVSFQVGSRWGGQRRPRGGETTNLYASERPNSTAVTRN